MAIGAVGPGRGEEQDLAGRVGDRQDDEVDHALAAVRHVVRHLRAVGLAAERARVGLGDLPAQRAHVEKDHRHGDDEQCRQDAESEPELLAGGQSQVSPVPLLQAAGRRRRSACTRAV